MKYGSLNVFSKIPNVKIYVDGKAAGTDSAQIKEIQAGTHFVKVTTGNASAEAIIYAEIIEINPGERTTLYVSDKGLEEKRETEDVKKDVDVFRAKRILDYSKEMHTGWYIKAGYLTNHYNNIEDPTLNAEATSLGIGLGFKIPLAQNLDFNLELERAGMNSAKQMWYFMPISANLQISYLPSAYFRGKQYYGLGIGYYMTDLETNLKQNLTALGYVLYYGMEMPASDKSAYLIQVSYHIADMSRYNYSLNALSVSAGYRWDVLE